MESVALAGRRAGRQSVAQAGRPADSLLRRQAGGRQSVAQAGRPADSLLRRQAGRPADILLRRQAGLRDLQDQEDERR